MSRRRQLPKVDIGAAFRDGKVIDEAMQKAWVHMARQHHRDGMPLICWDHEKQEVIRVDAGEALRKAGYEP